MQFRVTRGSRKLRMRKRSKIPSSFWLQGKKLGKQPASCFTFLLHNALLHFSYFSLMTQNAISLSKDTLQGSDKAAHVAVNAYKSSGGIILHLHVYCKLGFYDSLTFSTRNWYFIGFNILGHNSNTTLIILCGFKRNIWSMFLSVADFLLRKMSSPTMQNWWIMHVIVIDAEVEGNNVMRVTKKNIWNIFRTAN